MGNSIDSEIFVEMTRLLEKMAVESFAPVIAEPDTTPKMQQDAVLINLKTINAKYDKHEVLTHIWALMCKYNIQIDELIEQFKSMEYGARINQ
jgi:hypothetical protein